MKKHKGKIQMGIVIGIFSSILITCLVSVFSQLYTENKEKEEFRELPPIQKKILENAAKYVKVGGTLIYSTCTIQDNENINVVNEFLQKHKNFELAPIKEVNVDLDNQEKGYMKIYPNVHDMDGFFISKLIRVR